MRCCLANVAGALLLAACDPRPEPSRLPGATTLRDGLDREVILSLPAERIVTVGPSLTELVHAIGAGSQVIGRDSRSDYPPEAASLRAVGSGANLDLEALVALRPDLVLVAEIYSADQVRTIEKLGLRVFHVKNPLNFEDLGDRIALLGKITGRDEASRVLAASLLERARRLQERISRTTTRPLLYYELDATDLTRPYSAGPGTFLHTLIELSGAKNLAAETGEAYPRLSLETIVRRDPDLIVVGDKSASSTLESVRARPGWGGLGAVRRGAVVAFDGDLASRPGPRLVEALERLARLVHPEAFEAPGEGSP